MDKSPRQGLEIGKNTPPQIILILDPSLNPEVHLFQKFENEVFEINEEIKVLIMNFCQGQVG